MTLPLQQLSLQKRKVDIQKLKVNYIKRLKAIGANKSTLQKIDMLLNVVEVEQIFGRTEVIKGNTILHLRVYTAILLLDNSQRTLYYRV